MIATLTLLGCAVLTPDPDDDGLSWRDEVDLGTDPRNPDTDGDGLVDGDERLYLADPRVPDTDGDGLLDGEEVEIGTEPTREDTDQDGYLDPWEVEEGSDPTSSYYGIYEGGWPYNPDKDGATYGYPNWHLVDQFGQVVALHDFANQGVDVVIEGIGTPEPASHALAAWLSGISDPTYDALGPGIVKAIEDGRPIWIGVLVAGWQFNLPLEDDPVIWADAYPNDRIPILADQDAVAQASFSVSSYPFACLVDEQLQPLAACGDVEDTLVAAQRRLDGWEPPSLRSP